jgi:hypothetical protein
MKNGLEIDLWGTKRYFLNDLLHREDGPAIEWSYGNKEWYQYGKLHRVDGPACEYFNEYKYWYFHGKPMRCSSQKEFEEKITELIFT